MGGGGSDIDKTIAPITDSLKEAVGILQEEFGSVKLTLQGPTRAPPPSPEATSTTCCIAPTPARWGRLCGATNATALREFPSGG